MKSDEMTKPDATLIRIYIFKRKLDNCSSTQNGKCIEVKGVKDFDNSMN